VGLVGGILISRYLQKMLFGIAPLDPLTFALAPVVFATVVAGACYVPAKRATSVDPSVALRFQ